MADAAYFVFLDRVHTFAEAQYGLHMVWNWTEAAEAPILSPVLTATESTAPEDPAAAIHALTAQLRRGVIPNVSPEVRDLANRVVAEVAALDEDDADEWARRLADDAAQAED